MSDIEYRYLSGTPTSYLDEIFKLLPYDMFLISLPVHLYKNREYTSNHIKYYLLSNDISDRFTSVYGEEPFIFGTMAYELSEDWSHKIHYHNHTSVVVKTEYDDSPENEKIATAYLSDDYGNSIIPIYHPKAKAMYEIGELKFVAWPTLLPIDQNAADFDGWIYPDGRKVSKIKFSNAYRYFTNTYGPETTTDFTIPNIYDFFKAPNYSNSYDSSHLILAQPAVDILKTHKHDISEVIFSQTLKISVLFERVAENEEGVSNDALVDNKDSTAHVIAKLDTTVANSIFGTMKYDINADVQLVKDSEIESNIISREELQPTYPRFNYLPILMYIGVD